MKSIVTAENNTVLLNSGLNEMMFGKTKFSAAMNERGYIAENSVITPWIFSGSKTIGDEVFFCGSGFTGITVAEAAETSTPDVKTSIFYAICAAYTEAEKQNINLPAVSPYGILWDGSRLLFLPHSAFDRSCANLGKQKYEMLQGCWTDSVLSGRQAACFSRAVISYYALTGSLPYPPSETGSEANISYKNFLPLEYCINGIDRKLAEAVNTVLGGGEYTEQFPLKTLHSELFMQTPRPAAIPEEEFQLQTRIFRLKQQRKMNRGIKFRRYFTVTAAIAAAVVLSLVFTVNIIIENSKKPTAIGLTAAQTAEVFYSGIHTMDTDLMLAAAKHCPQAQGYISRVPQIFVISQMRSAYNFDAGLSTPENWVFFEPGSSKAYGHIIYGITNFIIDGTPSTLRKPAPRKNDHPYRQTRLNGEKLTRTSESSCTAEYYLVHTVDNMFEIKYYTDTIILKWMKNCWQIVNLEQSYTTQIINPAVFYEDYKEALEKSGGDIQEAIASIRTKYPWLPSAESIAEEEVKLDRQGF